MRLSLATAFVASTAGFVSAQAAGNVTTHTIMVGLNSGLTYTPSNITAAPNDIITFVFTSKNHTVTQSNFAAPCTQLTNTTVTPNIVGISSGFVPVNASSPEFPTWSFSVTDTNPLWFFCLQANHCQQGMVFSINATPQKSYDAFLAAAKSSNGTVPNPTTGGAATDPQGGSNPADVNSPSASSVPTSLPNGSPTAAGGAPATSSSGAAMVNMKAPSLFIGGMAVLLGVTL